MTEEKLKQKYEKAFYYLQQKSIHDLRRLARALSVAQPTSQAKNKLILSIVKVAAGEEVPAKATNRGAPTKAKKIETAELNGFMELFQNEAGREVVLKLTEKEFEYFAEMIYLGNLIIHGYQNTGKIEGYVNVADKVLREYYSLSCKTKVIAAIEENGIREVLIMLEKSTKKYVEQFEKRAFAEKLSEMLKDKIEDYLFKK